MNIKKRAFTGLTFFIILLAMALVFGCADSGNGGNNAPEVSEQFIDLQ